MSRPTSGELEKLTDPAEVEYVNAKRGTVPDDQLLDDLRQYRAINAANRRAELEEAQPVEATYASNSTAESEAVPIETTTDEPAATQVAAPTLEEFLAKAQPLNPDAPASALVQYWERTYGERGPADLPTLDDFLSEAQPKNPDRSVDELTAYWKDQYGSRGAMEHAPGVGETIWEGAKAAGRSLAAFGMTLHGDTEGVGEIAKEETVRNPALLRFMRELDKKKQQLGPDASWWDVGKALGSTAIEEPAGAGYLFAEQLPNTGVALGSAAAGAAIGSTLGPLGTIVGGLAGLFVANVGLETGGKALEKATDGMTDVERAEALREGVTKGSIISAVDTATFGATKWLTGTTARAMEAATIRVLLDEGIDIADRTAVQAATKNKLIAQRVQDAQAKAVEGVNTIAKRAARGGTEAGLETLGEGVGEYVGELAATGKGDKMEALVEAVSGFGQSAAEIGIAAGLSRREAFELRRQGENATAEVPPKTQTEIIREVGRTTDQVNAGIVKEIFGGETVDDAVKKAQDIVDQPPIGVTQLDDFIAKEKGEGVTRYTDAQRAVDQAAFERVIERAQGAERDATTGKLTFRGAPVEVVSPETLPESDAPLTKSHFEAISVALQAQGKRLVVVQDGTGFDGIVNQKREPNVVFITNKPSVDPTVVAFHEAGHLMQGTPLYRAFQELVIENLRPGGMKLAEKRHGDLGFGRLANEISADIAGDAMTDPAFMEKVFLRMQEQIGEQQAHEEAQTFLDKIKDIITKVHQAIVGRTFTTRDGRRLANLYVKNLEKIHEALSRAIADVYLRAGKPLTSTQKSQAEDITESRREGEERVILPTDVTTAFHEIGAIQRDRPERAMIKVQELAGGGVLNPVVEHIGDLTHRMTHMAGYGTALQPYVQEKVDRGLKYLTHAYGFEKEMLENLAANAAYNKMGKAELTLKVKEALAAYAAEHEKIPVYNLPQWLAKQAAIAVGRRKWDRAVAFLKELKKIADSKDFTTSAFAYARDKEGKLKPYRRPVHAALIALTPEGKLRISEDAERQQYHLTEDIGELRAGTKISKAELAQRGYEVAPSDLISHEEDRSRRALAEEGISESSSKKPTSDIGHKRQASGKYVGAPKEIVNPQKLISLRERLLRLAKEGEPGRLWYEESGKAILDLAEGNVSLAEKIVGLFAIYSPMSLVSGNTTVALKAYYQWATGEPITAINTQGKISAEKAQRWMDGTMNAHDVTGIKRNNFYKNLMRVINPKELGAEAQGVTVDMWIARALGYHQTVVGEAQYFFAEREIKRLANLLKWEPQQAQAAVWVSIKSRIEEVYDEVRNIATEKGWLIRGGYTNAAGKFIGEWKPKDANGRTHFERLLLAKALKIRTIDVEEASYNFADAIRERLAQISWEATPGKSTGVLPGIHLADYGKQAEYLDAIDTVLRDENGQDKIAVMVKLAGANTMLGPGGWQGNIGISGQTRTAVATDKNKVTEPARKLINLYSDIRGYILTQEGVYWHYPIYQEAKKRANGIEIDFGRPLSVEEMKALYDAIITWSGHDEWAPAYTERGVRILNFKDENHLGFHETIKVVLETFPLDSTWKTFGVDGDARMNNWKESPHGEEYVQRIREAGRPDLLGAVEDLRKAVLAVNRDFSERYGWGTATLPGDETTFSRSIELDHYSNARNLSTIHPKFHGTGQIGEERRRMESAEPGTYLPRSYFYRAGTKPEPRFKGMQKYRVSVPSEKIVDLATVEGKDATEREQNAKRAGYIGYFNSKSSMPNVVALFTPVKVQTDEAQLSRATSPWGDIPFQEEPFNTNNSWGFGGGSGTQYDFGNGITAKIGTASFRHLPDAKFITVSKNGRRLFDQPDTKRTRENAQRLVRDLLDEDQPLLSPAPMFYSQLERVLDAKMPGKASTQQVNGILANSGVKKEELEWLGMEQFLSGKTAVTKQEILDFVRANQVEIREVVKGAFSKEKLERIRQFRERERAITDRRDRGGQISSYTAMMQIDQARRDLGLTERDLLYNQDETRYRTYTLPGAKNYREILLTLPKDAALPTKTRTQYQLWDSEGIPYAAGDAESAARWRAEGRVVHEVQVPDRQARNDRRDFITSHFNEPNILAHVRIDDREGPNGEKILFLEEVQSDWHQTGKKKGYVKNRADLENREERLRMLVQRKDIMFRDVVRPRLIALELLGFDTMGKAINAIVEYADFANRWEMSESDKAVINEYRELKLEINKLTKEHDEDAFGVPDAPFKKSWPEFVMKRMLRYAAENGYTHIGWTTGEQQAERYDLSKHIDSLAYLPWKTPDGETKYNLEAGKDDRQLIKKTSLAEAELESFVGKELAQKIVNGEKTKTIGIENFEGEVDKWNVLSGLDLKVGGEGMKGFYDQILPAFMNKYGKKWGARVGVLEVGGVNMDARPFFNPDTGKDYYPTFEVHTLPITESMQQAVMEEGQPMFSPTQIDTPMFKRWFGDSKIVNQDGSPKVVYHGSAREFEGSTFKRGKGYKGKTSLGFHFGTRKAAELRIDPAVEKLRDVPSLAEEEGIAPAILPVYLKIEHPLLMRDIGAWHDPKWVAVGLYEAKIPNKEIESAVNAVRGPQSKLKALQELIKSKGYDGIIYKNTVEDKGNFSYIAFDPEQIKSAIGNIGTFDEENADITFSRTMNYPLEPPGRLDRLIRVLQDKNIDIKRVVESIRREGGSIPDELNPILKEEMYQKRAEQRTTDFTNDELRPLIEIMRVNKVDLQELDQYAHARHVITDKLNARLKALNPNMPNNDALSGLTDAEAQRIFASSSPERKQLLETLMQRVDRMVERTRDLMVDYGLEKESTIATWRKTYKSYVPLRREGFDEEGNPTGTGRSVRGSTAHPRVGSTLAVENVLANIAQARDQVITRGEKMRPVIAFAGLMMLHPNKSLASLDKPASIEMTDPTTGLLVTVPGDLADYKVPRVRRFNPATGRVESYPDPTYKGRDNVVNFRIAGVDYAIVFNERNERAMEVAKAFKELDSGKLTGVMKAVAPYTRYLASINTQYNPIFGIVNFVRDAQFAMLGLTSTPLAGMQGTVLKNAVSSLAGIYQDARDARYGLHPTSATAQMWERFQHVGGPTGYRDLFFTASDRAAEIERMLNPNTWANLRTPQKLARRLEDSAMFKLLSDYNLTMENAIRLGVFKTAVDRGLSDLQAASLAKNITVNFNKRGQVGAQMGSLYAFFNANVQGTARILETLFERTPEGGFRISSAGKKIIAGGLLLGVLQTFMLAIAGFDDDEPPEYIKNRNLVIPVPGTEKGYVMLPMPLGFNLLPNAGRLAAEVVRSAVSGRPAHVTEKGFSLLEAMFNSLSPTGGTGGIVTELSPTVTDPFVALATNKDWTGKAISKEDLSSLKPTPGHTRARDTATVWAMTLSRAINWATGGTDYTPGVLSPTPDAIDFMIQQATGGVGREVSKAAQVVKSAATGEELPFYKVPLLGRFAGSASGSSSVRDKFYDNIRAVNLAVEEIKGRALHQEEFQSFLRQNPEARFEKTANSIQRTIHDLQRQKHDMVKKGASRDAVRMKEEQILGLMRRFNTVLDENRKLR